MFYLYGQNTTDIFSHGIVRWVYNYMFRPVYWPLSGCNVNLTSSYTIFNDLSVHKQITNRQEHQTHTQMTQTCGHILRNNANSTNANQREE